MNISEIMEKYNAGKMTLEEANTELKEAGAPFHLEGGRDGGWTEQEMAEGFIPGKKAEVLPDKVVMKRCKELAGQTVVQRTKRGRYEVTYDNLGCVKKAVHL